MLDALGMTGTIPSRTVVLAESSSADTHFDAIDQREVYASEDQKLNVRFFVADRVPMGGRTQTPAASLGARLFIADPDYSSPFKLRLFHGTLGGEVELASEQTGVSGGWQSFDLDLAQPGEHFSYAEVLEVEANRAAWTAPIWIERI